MELSQYAYSEKSGEGGKHVAKKNGFSYFKSTKSTKWDNFYSQNVWNKDTKIFFLGNFFWFFIVLAKNWKKGFGTPP